MQQSKSIPEMNAEIRQLQDAMNLPGVPPDERAIYEATIARIRAAITARQGPVTPPPTPPPPEPIKHTAPMPAQTWKISSSDTMKEAADRELQRAQNQPLTTKSKPEAPHPPIGGAGGGKTHITKRGAIPVEKTRTLYATLNADHNTNPHNPIITITWADGYTFTGDETAIRGRFTSTLRDCAALRHVQNRQYEKMWRWDTPWRATGYLKAIAHLNGGKMPILADFGITRPSDIIKTVFELITLYAISFQSEKTL